VSEYKSLAQSTSIYSNQNKSFDINLDERDEIILEQDKKIRKLSFLTHKLNTSNTSKDKEFERNASNSIHSLDSKGSKGSHDVNELHDSKLFTFSNVKTNNSIVNSKKVQLNFNSNLNTSNSNDQ